MTTKRNGTEPHIDLDLTPLVPQVWNIKIAGHVYEVKSNQAPRTVHEIGAVSTALSVAMRTGEDTTQLEDEIADLMAGLLSVTKEEAALLGWSAAMNLFAFLAKPLNDLAATMRLSVPPLPSPTPSTEA